MKPDAVIEIKVFNSFEILFEKHGSRYFFSLCFIANSIFFCFLNISPNILQPCKRAAESSLKQQVQACKSLSAEFTTHFITACNLLGLQSAGLN